jgi:hypothetical protein
MKRETRTKESFDGGRSRHKNIKFNVNQKNIKFCFFLKINKVLNKSPTRTIWLIIMLLCATFWIGASGLAYYMVS